MTEDEKKQQVTEVVTESVDDLYPESLDEADSPELTHIPFKKSWELFWSNKSPSKKDKPNFFLWFPPNQSAHEKKIVFKIDCAIMSYVCLSYFVRYLDQTNISSAYVSGMQEDLNLKANQYNFITQIFSACYSFTGPFSTPLVTRIKPHLFMPILELVWGVCCLLIYKAKNFQTVAGLRAVQGMCEGAAWPAIHYILGSWYTKDELARRTSIFTASGIAGILLSGLIQSGLLAHMDGTDGIAGWRWLFIIDAIVTFPVAIYGFFIFPDTPNNSTPRFFLSKEEIEFCRERVKVNGKHSVNKFDWSIFKRTFTSYNWYLFVVAWILWIFADTALGFFSICLEGLGYNAYDRNNIPTIASGVGIASCVITGFIIDYTKRRWDIALVMTVLTVLGLGLVYAFKSPKAIIAGYCLQGIYYALSPLIVGWCNELAKEDDQMRALTIGSLNMVAGLISVPFNIFLFNTDYSPQFTMGNRASLICGVLLLFYMFLILQFDRYQNRKRDYIRELSESEVHYVPETSPLEKI